MKYIALKCEECGLVSVFPTSVSDGISCLECGGYITDFGHAKVQGKRMSEMTIDVEVNTKQLDKALKKAEKLAMIVADLSIEINKLGSKINNLGNE